jgi:hypothetical protein
VTFPTASFHVAPAPRGIFHREGAKYGKDKTLRVVFARRLLRAMKKLLKKGVDWKMGEP